MPQVSSVCGGAFGYGRGLQGALPNGGCGSYKMPGIGTVCSIALPYSSNMRFDTADYTFEYFVFFPVGTVSQLPPSTSAVFTTVNGRAAPLGLSFSNSGTGLTIFWNGLRWDSAGPTGQTAITLDTSTLVDQWSHWAFVQQSGVGQSLYVNGNRCKLLANVFTADPSETTPATYTFNIGYRNTPMFFSNIRLVKGYALYTGTTYTVPTSPLTAIPGTAYLLNATTRGPVKDTSPNNQRVINTSAANPVRWDPKTPFS